MNSNPSNQEKGHSAAEAHDIETQPVEGTTDQKAEPELSVTDKRRFTTDGEAIEREQDFQRDSTTEQAEAQSEVELLRARLKESEERRVEAEGQVRGLRIPFRHPQ